MLANHDTATHLSMILVYCRNANGDDLLPTAIRKQIRSTARALIPESVIAIRTTCMPGKAEATLASWGLQKRNRQRQCRSCRGNRSALNNKLMESTIKAPVHTHPRTGLLIWLISHL